MNNFLSRVLVLSLVIFGAPASSSVNVEYIKPDFETYTFKETCEKSGIRETPLITAPSLKELDCMGTIVSLNEFCLKNMLDAKNFSRGYAQAEQKKVFCQSANGLSLSINCTANNKKLCAHEKEACRDLQALYARNLKLVKSTLQMDGESNSQVSCYYLSHEQAKIDANLMGTSEFEALEKP
jgi:hypothetical protein